MFLSTIQIKEDISSSQLISGTGRRD